MVQGDAAAWHQPRMRADLSGHSSNAPPGFTSATVARRRSRLALEPGQQKLFRAARSRRVWRPSLPFGNWRLHAVKPDKCLRTQSGRPTVPSGRVTGSQALDSGRPGCVWGQALDIPFRSQAPRQHLVHCGRLPGGETNSAEATLRLPRTIALGAAESRPGHARGDGPRGRAVDAGLPQCRHELPVQARRGGSH